jgi:hypothetical protein
MTSRPSGQTWVLFVANADERLLRQIIDLDPDAQVSHYHIDQVSPVTGTPPPRLAPDLPLARIESHTPLLSAQPSPFCHNDLAIVFHGVVQNLHYTSAAQQKELDQRSRPELGPAPDTQAVLIPIRKSLAWWQLAQDQRQAHFQTSSAQPGHTVIGLEYVDRVYRRLYHSRYTILSVPYDFLTYFEFSQVHKDDFNRLLHELRETTRNPEWMYTELEYEIWMTKVG